ncbi:MAG: cytochrome family protein [Polaromonas sp.]|jgi:cytochrome P450|nr:cytochrome family protein [Polaromonas sp.]
MTSTATSPAQLESAFSAVSDLFKGADVDFHALCSEMRHNSPVYEGDFVARLGVPTNAGVHEPRPTVALFKYHDVMSVMKDATNFTNGFIAEGLGAFFDGLIILAMDGDQHRRVRALLQPAFMPASVNSWRPMIDRVMREDFLLPLVPAKRAELMDFGLNFPIRAIYAVMGFPEDDPEKYKQYAGWALTMLGGNQIDPAKVPEARKQAGIAVKALYDAIKEVVVERRAAGTDGDDLIHRLLRAEHEGKKLDDHEVATFVRSLLPAAGETTTRTFSSVMTQLLQRPGLMERVRNDRSLLAKVIDETVRFEPVATFKVRQAARDMEIGGVKIPKGGMVQCIVASANRDEDVFENAGEFNIDRRMKPSFGFGFGTHMCIGQFVAKIELTSAINTILDLFPNIRLDPDRPAPQITGAMLRGAKSVAVIWD